MTGKNGAGIFYTRDSGGRHETTPSEYVLWAKRKATEMGVSFTGSPEIIQEMIAGGLSHSGDLYLDYGVPGHELSREGLDAMAERAITDSSISTLFVPRRNRLFRPKDVMDAIEFETRLRRSGITIVYMDKVLDPLTKGERQSVTDLITATIEFDKSAEDRIELAQKVIYGQIHLAKNGFSTGGQPPFGFRRWLAKEDGTPVRELSKGEYVRKAGHHVVWLPGPESELNLIRRILDMLETMPASQVAAQLTAEGVPSPNAGRIREDNGVRHVVSGVWNQPTITNIARNPLLRAFTSYGRRSMGSELRVTPDGPRVLEDSDFRDDDRPKVIRNSQENEILGSAKFDPIVDPIKHENLIEKLDQRGGTQRGKPRSRDPKKNPLGCRIFDMNCGWPLYRIPYKDSFAYKCGQYMQSHGAVCDSNNVDGPTATKFLLSCVRQKLLMPGAVQELREKISELSKLSDHESSIEKTIMEKQTELAKLDEELQTISRNLARAKDDNQYAVIAEEFERSNNRKMEISQDITELKNRPTQQNAPTDKVESAMLLVERLANLADAPDGLESARQIFELIDARLFLSFCKHKMKKRTVNKVNGGVVTLGNCPPPIDIYSGRTDRKNVKKQKVGKETCSCPPNVSANSDEEDKSIGNVSRGERI